MVNAGILEILLEYESSEHCQHLPMLDQFSQVVGR